MQDLERLPHPEDEVPRPDVLARLHSAWEDSSQRFISIEGRGGIGKSCVLRQFLEVMLPEADGVVWSFYRSQDVEEFLDALHQAMTGTPSTARGWGRVEAVLDLLVARPFVLALDGVERMQGDEGSLTDDLLQSLFSRLPAGVRCLITTRLPVTGLGPLYRVPLEGLTLLQSLHLLQQWAPDMSDADRRGLAAACEGHPLLLRLSARAGLLGLATDDVASLEAHLAQVLELYRSRMSSEALRLLQVVCVARQPLSMSTLAGILKQPEHDVAYHIRGLARLGLLESNGQREWMAHPLVSAGFLRDADAATAHSEVASFLETRASRVQAAALPVHEDWIYHLCQSGQAARAYGVYRDLDGVRRMCLEWAESIRAERIVRMLLEVYEVPSRDSPRSSQ